jgi:glycosyltransferase involved in cell wall biosynthesis
MNIELMETYYGGSHRAWADELQRHSQHDIHLLTMPAQFWKWRMQGGALTMARLYHERRQAGIPHPDLLLMTDMLNVATLRAMLNTPAPIALYFHENQLTYPQNSRQKHGWRYGFINFISALASDAVLFSSEYHLRAFFDTLPKLLMHFADYRELHLIDQLRARSRVLALGMDLARFDAHRPETKQPNKTPLIVWNHRHEEDKQPAHFAQTLRTLAKRGIPFHLALLGEQVRQKVPEFDKLRKALKGRIVQDGYVGSFAEYARWLWRADVMVSTAVQEFFGIAMAQGIYCDTVPILPNRLNYPALLPDDLHEPCLYAHDSALLSKLKAHLVGDIRLTHEQRHALRTHIAHYDWSNRISDYDATFAQIVADGRRDVLV